MKEVDVLVSIGKLMTGLQLCKLQIEYAFLHWTLNTPGAEVTAIPTAVALAQSSRLNIMPVHIDMQSVHMSLEAARLQI